MRKTLTSWLTLLTAVATIALAPALVAARHMPRHVHAHREGHPLGRWRHGRHQPRHDPPDRHRHSRTRPLRLHHRQAQLQPVGPARSRIVLTKPAGVDDNDRYGRHLRYVNRGARDVGASQVRAGAWARYDSRDGYDRHPRQARYRSLDAAHRNYCGAGRPGSSGSTGGSTGGVSGPVRPSGKSCPASAPIKGNRESMIYHRPGQQYYAATNPEQCFRNAASAEAAGYRAARI